MASRRRKPPARRKPAKGRAPVRARARRSYLRRPRLPVLDQSQKDLLGLGLVAGDSSTYGLINGAVNLTSGLPSAAGRNTAVLSNTNIRLTAKSNVYTP